MVTVAPPVSPDPIPQVGSERSKKRETVLPIAPVEGLPLRRFTLDEYHSLIETGFFDEEERVELLEGVLVSMSPIHPPHANAVDLLLLVFSGLLARGGIRIRVQAPISIADSDSEPEPDLILLEDMGAAFAERHPSPSEVFLLVEVAESSLSIDRSKKGSLYAQAGITEYWIWNLVDDVLEVYRDPRSPSSGEALYQTKLTFSQGMSIAPLAFPDFKVVVDDLLSPATDEA
ncbi:MAG: Uma2 family endonuclease [Caldilineaceae bacterium]|nr:Uma2 family endonuclease [Caldilineaceae bacterium]MDE0339238.1 Uma2 family endonuclease [Caldilineaceae bacterium]